MTQREWEKALLKSLGKLPKEERRKIVEYYKELFGDKREAGMSEYEILLEFGSPEECAKRILTEEYGNDLPRHRSGGGVVKLVWLIIGLVFLSLLVILPLVCAAVGVVVGFGATAIGGCASVLGGVVLLIWSFCSFALGSAYVLALLGASLVAIGVGMLLAIGFYVLTKKIAIWSFRAVKWVYTRRFWYEKAV